MSNRILVFILLFSLSLIVVSLVLINKLDPGMKPKHSVDIIKLAAGEVKADEQFKLTTSDGKDFTHESLKNKYNVIYFGFTHCPEICPTILTNIGQAIDLLTEQELEKLQFIFVSVDPGRDTLEALKKFTQQFNNRIIGVTGKPEEVEKFSLSLKAYYSKIEKNDSADKDYLVDHSAFTYLLNPKAELITQFSPSASAKTMADYIKETIAKQE